MALRTSHCPLGCRFGITAVSGQSSPLSDKLPTDGPFDKPLAGGKAPIVVVSCWQVNKFTGSGVGACSAGSRVELSGHATKNQQHAANRHVRLMFHSESM
jgi:hypothetical protein